MKKYKIIISAFSIVGLVFSSFASITVANGDNPVDPPTINETLAVGESMVISKTVTTPVIPPKIDVCLLEDETGSFIDDIGNLQIAAPSIYDNVIAESPDAQFAVAGFRDYPFDPYGSDGSYLPKDWVYRSLSTMNSSKIAWLTGIANLSAGGGGDVQEAQYDAIVAAAGPGDFNDPTLGIQENCGWRDDPDVTRVLIVATDAPFHGPDGRHMNDHNSTSAVLNAQNIIIIGLKATTGSPGTELDALAAATGGSVQALSSSGDNIADAILLGLGNLPITVTPVPVGCDPLEVTFAPTSQTVTSGETTSFTETITVPSVPSLAGSSVLCTVEFRDDSGVSIGEQEISIEIPIAIDLNPDTAINELGTPEQMHSVIASVTSDSPLSSAVISDALVSFEIVSGPNMGAIGSGNTDSAGNAGFTYEAEQGILGLGMDVIKACVFGKDGRVVCDEVTKEWVDTTPPEVSCAETVNPSGKNVPPAGSIPPPGSKNGQNEDGFYQLLGEDAVSETEVCVVDEGSGYVIGCYASGTNVKYTEVAKKSWVKPWGNPESFVEYHIFGTGDMVIYAVDSAGNESERTTCYVPPLPK